MHITDDPDSEEGWVAYAFVQDVAASWEQYGRVAAALVEPAPAGLLLHVAGPTDEGFRTIGIWESEDAWGRFQAERLAPTIAALGGPARTDLPGRSGAPPRVRRGAHRPGVPASGRGSDEPLTHHR